MFTGIIEEVGRVLHIEKEEENVHFWIGAEFAPDLKIDQSVSHNGVCLTVVDKKERAYRVTAISETLAKTNLSLLSENSPVNLERGMKLGDRLDGHIVQGHVDQTGKCTRRNFKDGSWEFGFEYEPSSGNITIEKGSITVDGVSLTVVESRKGYFSVAVIPFTFDNTTFNVLKKGSDVNLEFDVIGKYIRRLSNL